MKTREVSNSDDVIDSRDVIARVEALEGERQGLADTVDEAAAALQERQESLDGWEGADESEELLAARNEASKTFDEARNAMDDWDEDNADELKAIKAMADEAAGYSEDWTYGSTLIRESYFVEYCQDLCDDIGDLPKNIPSYVVIDWEATASNLKADYTEVDYDGVTYLVR